MFEIDKHKFGAFVAAKRREKGYTQKELAQRLYVSDKAVSKWETGMSLPDTALLIPLAEQLGITVTELLRCRRIDRAVPIETSEVEALVQTAITLTEEKPPRAYQVQSRWKLLYLLTLGLGGLLLWIGSRHQLLGPTVPTAFLLAALFGGYFCFLVPLKLPAFYDQNRCGFFLDGPVRMNLPGIALTNANWPRILTVIRAWACLTLSLYPLLCILFLLVNAALWHQIELYACLTLLLGGLFIPLYLAGRRQDEAPGGDGSN